MTRRTYLAISDTLTGLLVLLILFAVGNGAVPWVGGTLCIVGLVGTCIMRRRI